MSADSHYIEDCRVVQRGITELEDIVQRVSKGISHEETETAATREAIDTGIAKIGELQRVLQKFKEYTLLAPTVAEKNQRKTMYKQLSDRLGGTAKRMEERIQTYIGKVKAESAKKKSALLEAEQAAEEAAAGGLYVDPAEQERQRRYFKTPQTSVVIFQKARLGVRVFFFWYVMESATEVHEADLALGEATAMRNVTEKMEGLQTLYIDLNEHVANQSAPLSTIEAEFLQASQLTADAADEVTITAEVRRKRSLQKAVVGVLCGVWVFWWFLF